MRSELKISCLALMVTVVVFSSCRTPDKIAYFQDLQFGESEQMVIESREIKVCPEDKLSIIVNTRDPQLTDLFNLPILSRQIGFSQTRGNTGQTQGVSGYTVDANGEIDFPVIGKIKVAGMNRVEIAEFIKKELISRDLVKDPVITVEFMNLHFSVLGEVKNPGQYQLDRERVTLLDAISMAGDLTIYGNREKVIVLREEGEKQHIYTVDLCWAEDVYTSPAFYLRQNDVVYVEPNKVRARQSTVNGNNVRSTSFWISLCSLLTSVLILVFD